MRFIRTWTLPALLAGSFASGCHYNVPERGEHDITGNLTDEIIKGQTTKKEIKKLLGKPHKSDLNIASSVWRYWYSPKSTVVFSSIGGNSFGDRRRWTLLTINFTPYGVVESYTVESYDAKLDDVDKEGGIEPKIGGTINLGH